MSQSLRLRDREGLIGFILALLGPHFAVLDHSALSRRAATLETALPQPDFTPVHLLTDGTWS